MSTGSQEYDNDNHPIVGDRVIKGDGTSKSSWQNWKGLQSLPVLNVKKSFNPQQRVCVFSPHPDDEILGCGGLLQQVAENGNDILLIQVTNGTQSHPKSTLYPPEQLDIVRPAESAAALDAMGLSHKTTTIAFNLQDGNVFKQKELFYEKISKVVQANDVLVAPFAYDGHPDHEATGQVVSSYAKNNKLICYQALIWAWHWAIPADKRIPWHRGARLDLSDTQLKLKTQAIYCFKSQITRDSSTGKPPILSANTIERISQPWEVYIYEQ